MSGVVYYNAIDTNLSAISRVVNFKETLPRNVLDKGSDYYLAIDRFQIQHSGFAMFDYRNEDYIIQIGDKVAIVPFVSRGNPYPIQFPDLQGIFAFEQFLEGLNTAFNNAHTALPASPGNPPVMVLEENGKFSIHVDTLYTEEIYLNNPTYRLFESLDARFVGYTGTNNYSIEYGKPSDEILPYTAPLTGNYYRMTQSGYSQGKWSDIKSIIISTKALPVKREFFTYTDRNEQNTEIAAISDFIPPETDGNLLDRSDWIYNAGSGYRLVDILSSAPLRTVDFQINFVNKTNKIIPLVLRPGETASIKFMFRKKSLESNAYYEKQFQ